MIAKLYHTYNLANLVICASMALIAPFFPPYVFSQGLGRGLVGFIFSLHPLGGMIGSLIIGKILNNNNRKHFMVFAMILQAICLLLFILTYYIRFYYFITLLSAITRFLNGIAYAAVLTAFYSYIPFLYPKQSEQMIALAESASALGYSMGPFFGSILYAIGGFPFPFFTCSAVSLYCAYLINQFDPSQIKTNTEIELQLLDQKEILIEPLSYKEALSHYTVVMNALMAVMVTTSFTLSFPILAQYLIDNFNLSPDSAGFFMSIGNFAYAVSTPIMIYLQNPNKPYIILIGQSANAISLFFQGPDTFFTGIDKNIYIFCMSSFVCYFSAAFTLIYSLPRMTDYLISQFPDQQERCTNISSAIFSASISLGEFSGPLFAGFLSNFIGYDRIASIIGIVILCICCGYIPTIKK